MSDSRSSGYYMDRYMDADKQPCPKAKKKGEKHEWEHKGSWPSMWKTCKHCGTSEFSK